MHFIYFLRRKVLLHFHNLISSISLLLLYSNSPTCSVYSFYFLRNGIHTFIMYTYSFVFIHSVFIPLFLLISCFSSVHLSFPYCFFCPVRSRRWWVKIVNFFRYVFFEWPLLIINCIDKNCVDKILINIEYELPD